MKNIKIIVSIVMMLSFLLNITLCVKLKLGGNLIVYHIDLREVTLDDILACNEMLRSKKSYKVVAAMKDNGYRIVMPSSLSEKEKSELCDEVIRFMDSRIGMNNYTSE